MTRSTISKRQRRRIRGKFKADAHRQSLAVALSTYAKEDQAFVDAVAVSFSDDDYGPEALAILEDLIHPPRDDRHDMPEWRLAERTRVLAVQEITEGAVTIPKGAVGTIVDVVRDGLGYDVEFTTPLHAVVAATREELQQV